MGEDFNSKLAMLAALLDGKEKLPDGLGDILAAFIESGAAAPNVKSTDRDIPPADADTPPDDYPLTGSEHADPRAGSVSNSGLTSGDEKTNQENSSISASDNDVLNNIQMMQKLGSVMEMYRAGNDPRVNLLRSVKPFLGGKRQQKLQKCISLLQMGGAVRMLGEVNK